MKKKIIPPEIKKEIGPKGDVSEIAAALDVLTDKIIDHSQR